MGSLQVHDWSMRQAGPDKSAYLSAQTSMGPPRSWSARFLVGSAPLPVLVCTLDEPLHPFPSPCIQSVIQRLILTLLYPIIFPTLHCIFYSTLIDAPRRERKRRQRRQRQEQCRPDYRKCSCFSYRWRKCVARSASLTDATRIEAYVT